MSIQNIKNAYKSTKNSLGFEIATNLFMRDGKSRTFVLRSDSEVVTSQKLKHGATLRSSCVLSLCLALLGVQAQRLIQGTFSNEATHFHLVR